MLQVSSLKKGYGGRTLFKDVSFSLNKRERVGLVGRNGSGKSTLMKIFAEEESADDGIVAYPKGYRVGYLKQHLHFTHPTVLEEAASLVPDESYKAEKILFGLGFDDELLEASPSSLSGGFGLRLQLAKVLIAEPDLLLLDEPTNYLDIVTLRWLKRFLNNWQGELILITHDREFMDGICSSILGLHRETLRKSIGGTKEYFDKLVIEEEIYEKTRQGLEKKKEHLEGYIRRFGAKASKATQAQSKMKALKKLPSLEKLASLDALDFSFNEAPFPGRLLLQADHLAFQWKMPLIHDVSLELEKEDRVAIIGKNGQGKTTLLNLLTGQLPLQSGTLKKAENGAFGIFGQTNINRLHPAHTIEEEIKLSNPDLSYGEVRAIAGLMMFSQDAAKKAIKVLSGGERSRVLLAKIIASPSNALFLDEPTHHLDMESVEALIQAVNSFSGAVVMVTHSELILNTVPWTKLIICEKKGQRLFLGNYQDFLDKGGWEDEAPLKKTKAAPPPPPPQKEPSLKKLEELIIADEASLQKAQDELLQASLERNLSRVQKLQKEIEQLEVKISKHYQSLNH